MNMDKLFLRWIMAFGTLMMFAVSGFGDVANNDTCPNIESVGNWTPVVSGTNTTLNGTLCESGGGVTCTLVDQYDYYRFTPGLEGTLDFTYGANQNSSLFITKTQCSNLTSNTYRVLNSGMSATPALSVSSTDTVYVGVLRNTNNALTSYTLGLGFTPTPVPVINNAGTSRSVVENSLAGTNVGTALTATNTPTGFSITGGTGASLFNISSSGQITVRSGAVLNYETATSYTLNINATNGGGNSAPVTVTINITNVAGPTITSSQTFSIVGGSANGTAVTPSTLAVTIPTPLPSGNTTTTYTISSGPFAISSTGVISVANTSALTVGSATYTVTATNAEGTDSKTITITVTPPPSAELAITKTVDNPIPLTGDNIIYTITVRNNGTLTSEVNVTDNLPLPTSLTNISTHESISGFSCTAIANNSVTCRSSGNTPYYLAPGNSISFTINATVAASATGTINNTATVGSYNNVYDSDLTNNTAVASITITTIKAIDDYYTMAYNSVLSGNVLTNDRGTSLSVTSNTSPTHGTLVLAADGTFTYTPITDYKGPDTFTYTITDSNSKTSQATVTIDVGTLFTGLHPFELINPENTKNIRGNYKIAGNTVMCLTELTDGYGGTCHGQTDYDLITSNMHVSKYIDIDGDSSTWNSTSSYVVLPTTYDNNPGRGILWAGLFWQGRISKDTQHPLQYGQANGSSYDLIETGENSNYGTLDITKTDANKIKLKVDTGNYALTQASTIYTNPTSGGVTYAAYSDVTSILQASNLAKGKHVFTVANLTTEQGREKNPGVFGGWSLVVIYAENSTGKTRNISVYSGFDEIQDPSTPFTITDFKLPTSGAVHSTLSLFSGEGEYLYGNRTNNTDKYDWVKLSNDDINYSYMPEAIHNDNIFDAILGGITRDDITGQSNNLQVNNDGVDIDSFDVSSLVTSYRDNNPDMHSMYIQWASNEDYITPSMLTFATELYEPKLCYDYTFKQDGQYLKTDNDGSQLPFMAGFVNSSPIDVSVYIRNIESDIDASNVSFYTTDVNASLFDYVHGSIASSNVNGSVMIPRDDSGTGCTYHDISTTPIGCSNGSNVRIGLGNDVTGYSINGAGNMGSQNYVYAKFSLNPKFSGIHDINESLGLAVDYTIRPNGVSKDIEYNYVLGVNMDMCPPTAGYQPTWGTFNVVDRQASTIGVLPANNLRTQVSRKPFDVDIAAYGKANDGTYTIPPTADLNTTVLVEIIDNDAFHDVNSSCANPDSNVSQSIYVPLTIKSGSISGMKATIPTQSIPFYNFAVKNASFRIWYFNDKDENLIQNWTADTSNNGLTLNANGLHNLYKSDTHLLCASGKPSPNCSNTLSTDCFECIKRNYAKPLCSRDNFSVRPESYDLRIFDINQTADVITKDSTKIDLSNQFQYAPMYINASGRMNVAAGYDYRYDMNATGNDHNLSAVPGYTRYFNGANNDYNVTMIWAPHTGQVTTGCNDITSKALVLYIANGQMINQEQNESQVGDYQLNVVDPAWTAVDWKTGLIGTAHHTVANGFETTKEDCILNSDITPSSGKAGCVTTSAHIGGGYNYKDHLLTLQPYKFTIPSTFRYGTVPYDLNTTWSYDENLTNDVLTQANIIYYSKLSNNADLNMSLQIDGSIGAVGYNGTSLSNFVRDCYAKSINLILDHNRTVQTRTAYQSRFLDYNSTGSLIYDSGAINVPGIGAATIQTVNDGNFSKDMNGALDSKVRVNFDRNASVVLNPMSVRFYDYQVNCPDCNRSADLSAAIASGSVGMGFDVMHFYGRAQGRDASYSTATTTAGGYARIYFETYCSDTANAANGGVDCDMGALTSYMAGESPGWYVNIDHNITNDGKSDSDNTLSTGNLKVGTTIVPPLGSVSITPTEVGFERYGVNYNGGNGYPYSTTVNNYADGWLIYNTSNSNILYNTFGLEFHKKGAWIGEGKSGTATDNDAPIKTNRRIMW